MNKRMPEIAPVLIDTKDRNFFYQLYVVIFNVRNWVLTRDWYIELPNGTLICIPQGFQMDGASIPKPFWFLLSPVGPLLLPGIVHDYAYRHNYLWAVCKQTGVPFKYGHCAGQKFFDGIFKDISLSVSGLKVVSIFSYLTLRAFGFLAWSANRKKESPEMYPAMRVGSLDQRVDFICD